MITALAVLSGAAGLVYEVAWTRRLAQLCGGTALAQTITLAAFLGGLAAGSAWLGRRAGAGRGALSFYARLEWLLAASGLAAPALLWAADKTGAVWAAAAAVAAQAFLMGGALPALCGALGGESQRSVSGAYAANTAGAVAGALLAGTALIPLLGLDGSFYAAAALNALAALGASRAAAREAARERPAAPEPPAAVSPALARAAMLAAGFVTLTYEACWTRILALTIGCSAYSFAEMLAAIIAGLSAGSALAGRPFFRRLDPALLLGGALLGAGLCVLATLPFYDDLPYAFALLQSRLPRTAGGFYVAEALKFLSSFLLLLPPTLCIGLAFPAAARVCEGSGSDRAQEVGLLLAWNTAGNVLGAAASLWLVPWLGVEGVLRSGTTVQLAVGAGLLLAARPPATAAARFAALGVLVALVAARAAVPRWDLLALSKGLYRGKANTEQLVETLRAVSADMRLLFYRDDREASVAVLRFGDGTLVLKVNGKTDASDSTDMTTQIMLGQLPMLLKPEAKRALLIGWGSGVTAGSLLTHPLERLDAVELVPSVVEASRLFAHVNRGALEDPRLRLAVEDARAFLRRPQARGYDVIVSEPSNPWMAGVGDLFSSEFYQRTKAALSPGGIITQWMHAYEMDDETLALTLRTFCAAYPHAALWTHGSDLLLIGSMEPLKTDWKAMDRGFERERVWRDLKRLDILYPATLLSMQRLGDVSLRALAGKGPLNTEKRPILEYAAPAALFRDTQASAVYAVDDRLDRARAGDLLLARYLAARGRPLARGEYVNLVLGPRAKSELPLVEAFVREWVARFPRDEAARKILAEVLAEAESRR